MSSHLFRYVYRYASFAFVMHFDNFVSFLSNICIHLNPPHILALPCNGDPSRKSRTPSATEIAYALILASIWKTTGTNKNSRLLQGHTALGLSAGGCGLPVWCFVGE